MTDLGNAVDDRVWLVESVLGTDYSAPPDIVPPPPEEAAAVWAPWGSFAWGALPFGATPTGLLRPYEFKVASRDWITAEDDPDRPSQFWEGRLINAGDLTRSISLTSVGEAAVETSTGTVTIDNNDGEFDSVLDDFEAVSQQVAIKRAISGADWSDYETLWMMRITGINMSEAELGLELAEPLAYAQNFFPVTYYGGGGLADGDASLAGVMKPVALGVIWNTSPVLINAVGLIYQLHDGPVFNIKGVFDGGAALTYSGTNVATYAALAAASVPAGQYTTCTALGLLKLGSSPARSVTAHIDGATAAGKNVKTIATWLIGALAPQIWLSVDSAAFTALPLWEAGWVWTEPFTYQEAISRFVGDAGFVWGTLQPGPLTVAQLTGPIESASVRSFDEADIIALERVSLPGGYESTHLRRIVRYQKNWTVQPGSDLVATAVDAAFRGQEWKSAISNSATASRNALDPPILDTSLAIAADALSLANSQIALHGVRRKLYSLTVQMTGLVPPLTSTVMVTYTRFGLIGGEPFRVVSVAHDFRQGEMTLLLWG